MMTMMDKMMVKVRMVSADDAGNDDDHGGGKKGTTKATTTLTPAATLTMAMVMITAGANDLTEKLNLLIGPR